MAKGLFALYGGKGKVGNMVAYKNPNTNNADTTVVRAYTANVKNPKTRKQAEQRMRMLPAQNFYRAFRTLLDHSWQGVKYGGRSYAKFMKMALADKTLAIPYQEKGDSSFVPGPYPMASGSLMAVGVLPIEDSANFVHTSLVLSSFQPGVGATVGQFSQDLINSNNGFEDGDFLTFIQVSYSNGEFITTFKRLKLDISSTDLFGATYPGLDSDSVQGADYVSFNLLSGEIVGAAVIHSREPEQGSTTWLRSNASMVLAAGAISGYRTAEAEAKAIESYMSRAGETNSHWYLNGGTE